MLNVRELNIIYEGLDRVDGSATFGFGTSSLKLIAKACSLPSGETKALASVSGPIEVRPNLELASQATLDVHVRPLASISGTDSKALATTLKAILTPALLLSHHPRTLVQIVGQALCGSHSGSGLGSAGKGWNASLIASLVNASSAALVNASSVPMRGVVCAVSVGRLPSQKETILILDPSEPELPRLSGGGCFAFLFSSVLASVSPSETNIPSCSLLWTSYTTKTPFDESELMQAQKLAEKGARQVWGTLKESVGWMERSSITVQEWKKERKRIVKETTQETSIQVDGDNEVDDEKMEI